MSIFSSFSDSIKDKVDFLRIDNNKNQDYMLYKTGKQVLNVNKKQVVDIVHEPTIDFYLQPKNQYPSTFSGQEFYIDFELNKFDYTFYQFLLRFEITNLSTGANAKMLPYPLFISRVSVLKNQNTMGNDIYDYDIMLYYRIKNGVDKDKNIKYKIIDKNENIITDMKILNYIKSLVIPPAYDDVTIFYEKSPKILFQGFDNKGRLQQIYSANHKKESSKKKFCHLMEFGKILSKIENDISLILGVVPLAGGIGVYVG